MSGMIWENLRLNKCPQCNKSWVFDLKVSDGMMFHKCGFKISEKRCIEIISTMNQKNIDEDINVWKKKKL